MKNFFCLLTSAFVLAFALRAETPNKQIRVIVDTSQSLHKNDPSGYVKLATALLYDLAFETLNAKDSFKVMQFDPNWPKQTSPPSTCPEPMEPGRGGADKTKFIQDILNIRYDGPWTYFTPCFQRAYEDLRHSGGPSDNRVIILITDGVPDPQVKEADGRLLAELARKLPAERIQVYVIAFGPDIDKSENKGWFTQAFQFGNPQGVRGEAFERSDAKHLASDMLEIFSRSFGYSRQTFSSAPTQLDVAGDLTLERAAVVALYQQSGDPDFQLTPPGGSSLGPDQLQRRRGNPDPAPKGPVLPVSYAYHWLRQPAKGNYGLRINGPAPVEVAVLRPIQVDIKVRPYQGNPTGVAMAGEPAPMEVLVSASGGSSGDPGKDLQVQFYQRYLKPDDNRAPNFHVADPGPHGNGEGEKRPEGRVFVIRPNFDRDPQQWPQGTQYPGFIDIEVTQYQTPVERLWERMHPVQVYPFVKIQPNPDRAVAKADSGRRELLAASDVGCVEFQFSGIAGRLDDGAYTIGVRLDPPPQASGALAGVRFRFDGTEIESRPPGSVSWQATVPFQKSDLNSKTHHFCIVPGRPLREDRNHEFNVKFGLWKNASDPYEHLNVVEHLVMTASIAAPDFWQTWSSWLTLLLTMLLLYLLYLFLKLRKSLAPDLSVALGDGAFALTPARLGEESFGTRWLGLPKDRSVISLAGDKEIGRVRPLEKELFAFLPAKGLGSISWEERGEWRPVEPGADGTWLLSAGRVYRAQGAAEPHFFRLDYSGERPRI